MHVFHSSHYFFFFFVLITLLFTFWIFLCIFCNSFLIWKKIINDNKKLSEWIFFFFNLSFIYIYIYIYILNFFYFWENIYSKLESYLSCDPIHSRIIYMLTLKKKSSTFFNSILTFQIIYIYIYIYMYVYTYTFSIIESINNCVRIWICLTILH